MSLFPNSVRELRVRMMQAGAAGLGAAMVAGCGGAYRSVVTSTNPSGPASQPSSRAIVVSYPPSSDNGIATIIDYSGDTIMATAKIGPDPQSFTVDASGSNGYTVNSDGTVTVFPATTSLLQKSVSYGTLPSTAEPVGMFSPASGLWVTDLDDNSVDVMSGSPLTFKLAIPVAATPVTMAGSGSSAKRYYAISLNNSSTPTGSVISFNDMTCNSAPTTVTQNGEADGIETTSTSGQYSVSSYLALGKCPVYAVSNSDGSRLFVLNRGSDTITVINTQTNTLDSCTPFQNQAGQTVTCHPTLPLSTTAVTDTGITPTNGSTAANLQTVAGPVYAEYNAATEQLVVANYDGGTVSIIDVSMDEYGNDSSTFGTTYTVAVGKTSTPHPAAVTALYAGDRAYTANQSDDSGSTGNGSVSVINLKSHTLEKTLSVVGHPRTVVSTSNSLYGKVYVASPDSDYVTVLDVSSDTVDTTVLVQGNVIDVRTSAQNGTSGNANILSRRPGAGQPCYLPDSAALASITSCRSISLQ
jgi:DNA-binding beta-propeller fold protein YncE